MFGAVREMVRKHRLLRREGQGNPDSQVFRSSIRVMKGVIYRLGAPSPKDCTLNSSFCQVLCYAGELFMKVNVPSLLLVLVVLAAPGQVSADVTFPQNGSSLTYTALATAQTSQGNISATSSDSYSFQQAGTQWNVTETITGKITCFPPTAQLSVRFLTTADIMGVQSTVSNDPSIDIKVSYLVRDRVVESTPIGSSVPAGYSAKCTLGGNDVASVSQATPALYASGFRYYVLFYIQPTGITVGSSVPVAIMTSTISGVQNVTVLNTPRPALVGTLTGIISGTLYWDRDSGILLLGQSTSSSQSDRMALTYSTVPIAEFHLPQVVAIITTIFVLFALTGNRKQATNPHRFNKSGN
jgi:hypothetical protein